MTYALHLFELFGDFMTKYNVGMNEVRDAYVLMLTSCAEGSMTPEMVVSGELDWCTVEMVFFLAGGTDARLQDEAVDDARHAAIMASLPEPQRTQLLHLSKKIADDVIVCLNE